MISMPNHHQLLCRLQRRLVAGLCFDRTAAVLVVWALVVATAVLVAAAAARVPAQRLLLPAGIALGLGLVWAVAGAVRRRPGLDRLAALVDDRLHLGGLLVAATETGIGEWQSQLHGLVMPRARWHGRQRLLLLAGALLYLLAALLVPLRAGSEGSRPLDLAREVAALDQRIQVLDEAELIEPETTEQLQTTLQELRAEALADEPAMAYETLDRTALQVGQLATGALTRLLAEEQRLAEAAALTAALRADTGVLSDNRHAELQAAARALAEELQALDPGLLEALRSAASPEQLERLATALAGKRTELLARLAQLQAAELVNARLVKDCARCQGRDSGKEGEQLLAMLAEADPDQPAAAVAAAVSAAGSLAGLSRGRGDAAMTWRDATETGDTAFEEQILPPAALAELRQAQLVGLSATAPEVPDRVAPAAAGSLEAPAGVGGAALGRQVLPRHRQVIRRYFERDGPARSAAGPGGD